MLEMYPIHCLPNVSLIMKSNVREYVSVVCLNGINCLSN